MRRYDDPVEVPQGDGGRRAGGQVEGPEQFLWRGRLWKVYDVVAHWVETGAWWQSAEVAPVLGADDECGTAARAPRCTTCSPSARSGGWRRPRAAPRLEAPAGRLRPRLRLGPGHLAPRPVRGLRGRRDDPRYRTGRPSVLRRPGRDLRLPRAGGLLPAGGDHRDRRRDALRPRPRGRAAGDRRAARRPRQPRSAAGGAGPPQRNAWVLLAEVAPEFAEWAAFFSAGAAKRAAAEAGSRRAVTEREADDLVRDADRFLGAGRGVPRAHPAPAGPGDRLVRVAAGEPVGDPFVHLHVASGYSLQYGASHPAGAGGAGRRAGDGHPGAHRPRRHLRRGPVRQGLPAAGVRPVLGVDLALAPTGRGARPVRRSAPPPRAAAPRCAAVPSATRGCRGSPSWPAAGRGGRRSAGWSRPPTSPASAATRCAPSTWSPSTPPGRDVLVLLGPASELGARRHRCAATTSRSRGAAPVARAVRPRRPPGRGGRPPAAGARARARPRTRPGWPGWRGRPALGAVLSNAVRYADRADAVVVDVLDAARRLVPLDLRHVDRRQRRGVPQVRQGDGRGRRGGLPDGRARASAGRPRAAGAHPGGGRPVRGRPAGRPRAGGGALPRAGGRPPGRGRRRRRHRRRGAAGAVRGRRSAGATATPPGSASGSGSTTSCSSSASSATRRTSSPSPTSAT